MPDNMVKNVGLIQELNGNIGISIRMILGKPFLLVVEEREEEGRRKGYYYPFTQKLRLLRVKKSFQMCLADVS